MKKQVQAAQILSRTPLPNVSVVDDDPDLLTFFKDLADSGRFKLLGAYRNAGAALSDLPQRPPDILFMDVRLPHMPGIECARRLTVLLPGLRIIVITGHPEQSILLQAFMAGAVGFVIKPCTIDDTMAAIDEVLNGGVALGKTALPYLRWIIRRFRHLDPAWDLTEREEQIITCIFEGKSDKEIASALGIGFATVRTHMNRLFEKLGVHSREELIAEFLQH